MGVLSFITFMPLLGGIIILLTPKDKVQVVRAIAAAASAAVFVASLWLWANFNPTTSDFQFTEKFDWISAFNIHYFMGVDGLSLVLLVLTTLLTLLSVTPYLKNAVIFFVNCWSKLKATPLAPLVTTSICVGR